MAVTPMMEQYFQIKEQYKDFILFYRLGDFYEMFYDDAVTASRELDLVLTGRDCGEDKRAPMCGVPFHSCDGYIAKLIEKGYKIAICEQMEDPALSKGLVKRDVIRVITPGTVIDGAMLTETRNNYLCAICADSADIGICFADISTGEIAATSVTTEQEIITELGTYLPREIITDVPEAMMPQVAAFARDRIGALYEAGQTSRFNFERSEKLLSEQFNDDFEGNNHPLPGTSKAVGAIIEYIRETQFSDCSHINQLSLYTYGQYIGMDIATRRNLELTETMLRKEKRGSLFWVLDNTVTAAGARLLRNWVEHPLVDVSAILNRQGAVAELYSDIIIRDDMAALLDGTLDLERLLTKVIYSTANAKDLRGISTTLKRLPELKNLISSSVSAELSKITSELDTLEDVYEKIDSSLNELPPFSLREGDLIRDGYNTDVDYLRSVMSDGKGWIEKIEADEREATGIKTLKVGYNRVFGYYIEVTKSQSEFVPPTYIRKQTLSNCERYITDDLKNKEATILGAADKLNSLEYDLFCEIRNAVAAEASRIQSTAVLIAKLDAYQSLAKAAAKNNYVKPEIDISDVIEIKDGRHPVVECFVSDSYFVPNDTLLDTRDNRLMLITGPNMAGKSTYMRQTALITLMAQIGSFVPAKEARIGVVDKIFTRVGASDDLASGQSTFMLEMNEVAAILKGATRKSLIIYDEIGRGTSTYDGMSIARAVAEYTASRKIGSKTMFATHYHELTSLEGKYPGIVNYNIAAKKRGDTITFLRKIIRGATDDSYGIEVAKLAGVPSEVVKRAREILVEIESGEHKYNAQPQKQTEENSVISIQELAASTVADKLRSMDINTLTPFEAMGVLFDLKKLLV